MNRNPFSDRLAGRIVLVVATLLSPGLAGPGWPAEAPKSEDFTGLVDIGGGRKMYLECRGAGAPAVILISGLLGSAEAWSTVTKPDAPEVFPEIAKVTRVCAYDRPGTPVGEGPSRSDPVPQPTATQGATTDLYDLLHAAEVPAPTFSRRIPMAARSHCSMRASIPARSRAWFWSMSCRTASRKR